MVSSIRFGHVTYWSASNQTDKEQKIQFKIDGDDMPQFAKLPELFQFNEVYKWDVMVKSGHFYYGNHSHPEHMQTVPAKLKPLVARLIGKAKKASGFKAYVSREQLVRYLRPTKHALKKALKEISKPNQPPRIKANPVAVTRPQSGLRNTKAESVRKGQQRRK